MTPPQQSSTNRRWYQAIGPGLITACVVIGPGSILSSSNVGVTQGYGMAWVVVLSVIFMLTYMTMGAKLGVAQSLSPAELIRTRLGSGIAVLVGLSVFFISAAFQFGNNLGVHLALVEFIDFDYIVVLFNAVAIAFLLVFKEQYKLLERLMMLFVGLMLVSFAINLLTAFVIDPRPAEILSGFNPLSSQTIDINVLGLIGTTFVVSAAFYQCYLVKHKGWKAADLRTGLIDVRVGATIMGLITLMLIFTPATMFYPVYKNQQIVTHYDALAKAAPNLGLQPQTKADKDLPSYMVITMVPDDPQYAALSKKIIAETKKNAKGEQVPKWSIIDQSQLMTANSALAADQRAVLKPRSFGDIVEIGSSLQSLFRGLGPTIFFLGVFAAAYSSFLVNSMIGGFILADSLGLGNTPDDKWPRIFTICVLLIGMVVGLYAIIVLEGAKPVTLVVTAQAVTVIASPLVAGILLYLTSSESIMGKNKNGPLLNILGTIGLLMLIAMSLRTLWTAVLPKLGF